MSGNPGLTQAQEDRLQDGAVVCDALGVIYRMTDHGERHWMHEGRRVGLDKPRRPLVRLDNPPQVP